jgi:hypothetical protein
VFAPALYVVFVGQPTCQDLPLWLHFVNGKGERRVMLW